MTEIFDSIVIGAGIMGSSTAYALSEQGQKVLLLEQFDLDHKKGSSNDNTRIIRYSYDHPTYIRLAEPNYQLWNQIESKSGQKLLYKTGGIDFGTPDQPYIRNALTSAQQTGLHYDQLTANEAESRFPHFRFNDDMTVLYQAESGLLAAGRCVTTFLTLAQKQGATLQDQASVTEIQVESTSVTVKTTQGTFSAGNLIITAGMWSKSLLAQLGLDLPLTPMRCQVAYFDTPDLAQYEPPNMPVFIAVVPDVYNDNMVYGIPSLDGCGVKIAFHGGQHLNHPSELNYDPDDETVEQLRAFARDHLPEADNDLIFTRICPYTMTPDDHFIIDHHPEHKHIVFGAGFSGHGFKFGAIIGDILKDLTLNSTTPHDIDLFNVNRFLH